MWLVIGLFFSIWAALVAPFWFLIPVGIFVLLFTPYRTLLMVVIFLVILMSGGVFVKIIIATGLLGILIISVDYIKQFLKIPQIVE